MKKPLLPKQNLTQAPNTGKKPDSKSAPYRKACFER